MSQAINSDLKILNERFDAYTGNWCVDPFIGRDGTISVWPTKDGFAHDLNGTPLPNSFWPLCHCTPTIEEQPNGVVLVIHNAMRGDAPTPTVKVQIEDGTFRLARGATPPVEGAAEVTLHADRILPPDLAEALADLARAIVDSTTQPRPPSYAVFVCAQGVISCRSIGHHREHDLAERPFIRAEDSSSDAQTVTFGEGAADQSQGDR